MLKIYFFILLFLISANCAALDTRLQAHKSDFHFILTNNTNESIDIAAQLILGDCKHFANICLNIRNEEGKKIDILAMPMNFDHSFSSRIELLPNRFYGVIRNKNKIARRFGLVDGCYDVSLIYKDRKHKITVESKPIKFAVKNSKAITNSRCQAEHK